MALSVSSVWTGATTVSSAWVRARTTPATSATLQVADNEAMVGPVLLGPVAPGADGVVSWLVTGLEPNTRYWCLIDDGALNTSWKSTFRTQPGPVGEPLSYTFGAAGDAGLTGVGDASYITSQVSNNPVFDTMKAQSLAEEWAWFSHLGDIHYRNIAVNDPALFRTAYFDTMNYGNFVNPSARQGQFFRSVASTYVWDDHDYGPNDSNRTSASRLAAQQVYREWVPHYALPSASGIYQSWQVGRVLYIASDVRSFRDPNSNPEGPAKTMLGTAQKAWMENLLATTDAEALVWQVPSRWIGGSDTWSSFTHERDAMVQMFGDLGWLNRMIYMTADEHALSICSGPYNPYGRFPMFMFASLDSSYGANTREIYDVGQSQGRRQYGTMRVRDDGHTIALTGTGWIDGTEWKTHTAYVHVGSPAIAVSYPSGHISEPFEPTDDDQGLRNDIIAKRQDGGEAHYVKDRGPLNVNDPAVDPDGVGTYDEEVTLNVASDSQLGAQAGWRVHLGTVDEARYPVMNINLAKNPALADTLCGLNLGDAISVTDPPPWLPPDDIRLIAEGGSETLSLEQWTVELNGSPGSSWAVAQLPPGDASTAGPNLPNRLDTSGSQLVTAVDADDTELIVHTPQNGKHSRAVWMNSAGPAPTFADHFPVDLRLGGETLRATAIAPFSWDQFTRTVANGWDTSSSGHAWTLVGGFNSERSCNGTGGVVTLSGATPTNTRFQTQPGSVGDCEVRVRVSASQVSTGASLPASILLRYTSSSVNYRARLHFGTSGALFASVTRNTTQIGSTVTLRGTYAAGAAFQVRVRLVGHRILMRVWPDATTEPDVWHVDETVVTDPIATGQVGLAASVFSGNTNVAPAVVYDDWQVISPQRVTATRSLNTVIKAHAAGAAVSLAQPAVAAL
ncbi:alkaline phosphatase D family protein [Streptomyces sp. NPDC002994]|uniref:alkaline phosphatase D family protein n=1 Tax=Streptomyces sp. NPDC002994 TaxID=3154441 RepID=UPI0033AE7670